MVCVLSTLPYIQGIYGLAGSKCIRMKFYLFLHSQLHNCGMCPDEMWYRAGFFEVAES